MRELRYSVASSLDGYIAGPNGEFDWIVVDPEIDFAALYASFGGLVMGRRSYEVFVATGGAVGPALPTYVYSRSLPEGDRDGVTFARDAVSHVRALKAAGDGKPLWLWGGGDLCRHLAQAGLVDGVDVAIIPIILGGGLPLFATPGPRVRLRLRSHRLFAATGILSLEYDVHRSQLDGRAELTDRRERFAEPLTKPNRGLAERREHLRLARSLELLARDDIAGCAAGRDQIDDITPVALGDRAGDPCPNASST